MTTPPLRDPAAAEPDAGDPRAAPPLTPQQSQQILPILDHAITTGMGDLRAAIAVAFYTEDASYYRGLHAAYALLHAPLQVAARRSKALLTAPPAGPSPDPRRPANPPS